jgi:hypothetical protein
VSLTLDIEEANTVLFRYCRLLVTTVVWTLVCLGIQGRTVAAQGAPVVVAFDHKIPQAAFAASEIKAALGAEHRSAIFLDLDGFLPSRYSTCIVLGASLAESNRLASALRVPPPARTGAQAYGLRRRTSPTGLTIYIVLGVDPAGAMYGGLDVAEAIREGRLSAVQSSDHEPYIARRGLKFNIPLDARTPSYSDASDSAQQNIPEVWSMEFWQQSNSTLPMTLRARIWCARRN